MQICSGPWIIVASLWSSRFGHAWPCSPEALHPIPSARQTPPWLLEKPPATTPLFFPPLQPSSPVVKPETISAHAYGLSHPDPGSAEAGSTQCVSRCGRGPVGPVGSAFQPRSISSGRSDDNKYRSLASQTPARTATNSPYSRHPDALHPAARAAECAGTCQREHNLLGGQGHTRHSDGRHSRCWTAGTDAPAGDLQLDATPTLGS